MLLTETAGENQALGGGGSSGCWQILWVEPLWTSAAFQSQADGGRGYSWIDIKNSFLDYLGGVKGCRWIIEALDLDWDRLWLGHVLQLSAGGGSDWQQLQVEVGTGQFNYI